MASRECRDCGEAIEWKEAGGRWIPIDPTTQERHRCQIDQRCESCSDVFPGAPWMKQCPKFYKAGRPIGHNTDAEPARSSRSREVLTEDPSDDDPF